MRTKRFAEANRRPRIPSIHNVKDQKPGPGAPTTPGREAGLYARAQALSMPLATAKTRAPPGLSGACPRGRQTPIPRPAGMPWPRPCFLRARGKYRLPPAAAVV